MGPAPIETGPNGDDSDAPSTVFQYASPSSVAATSEFPVTSTSTGRPGRIVDGRAVMLRLAVGSRTANGSFAAACGGPAGSPGGSRYAHSAYGCEMPAPRVPRSPAIE